VNSLFNKIKNIFTESVEYHTKTPSAVFKAFISMVLIQFAMLSLVSIGCGVKDIPVAEGVVSSAHFWWGLLGLFGASALAFEKYIKGDKLMLVLGYLSAILSLSVLTYDFAGSQPPILTGGILTATAIMFLGGLLYGRLKA